MNRDQRVVAVATLAVALWGLSQSLVPFTVTSGFLGPHSCSPAVVSHSAEDPDLPAEFGPRGPDDLVDTCAKAARRRLATTGVVLVLSAVGGYGGFLLLRERRQDADQDEVTDPVEEERDFSPYDPE